jgi:hypothetical protein
MLNKDKTIAKALSKYHSILPIRGKQSLDDCFICVRGDYFFLFKTEDKTKHIMKAELSQPVFASPIMSPEFFSSIFKTLNTPISVQSPLLVKTEISLPVILTMQINREFFITVYRTLNQPVILRSPLIITAP